MLFLDAAALPKAVDWIPVPSQQEIACTVGIAVTFLRMALRHATRTLFSSQSTTDLFSHWREKPEMLRGSSQERLTTASKEAWLAAG